MTPDPPPQDHETEPTDPYHGGPLGAGIDWTDPNSRLAPLYMTAGGLIGVAVLGLAFLLFSTFPLRHTDFWSHLKYGEWIAAHRTLPDREPLSPFTDKQTPMFDAMWLSQVGYHGLFRAGESLAGGGARRRFEGGVEVIRLTHVLAAVAALGFFGLAYRRVSDSVPWGVGGMVFLVLPIVGPMLGSFAVQRPQTLVLPCYAALLCLLSRPGPTRRAVILAPLSLVLWANLHGSFVIGVGLIGVILLGKAIELGRENGWSLRAIGRDPPTRRLCAMLILSVVAVAILNPYGPSLYVDVVKFGESPNLRTMAEWQPLDFSEARGGHWGYLAMLALLGLTQAVSPRGFTPTQLLLVVTLGLGPLFQQRLMVWWAPLVPWIIAPHGVAAAERGRWLLPPSVPSLRRTALAAVLVVLAVVASQSSTWVKTGRPRPLAAALHPETPYDIAAALSGQPPANPDRVADLLRVVREEYGGRYTGRVFASEIQGEYLLWALPEDAPVLLYNHVQLFPPDRWAEYMTVKVAAPGWWEILDRYRVGIVVVEVDSHPRLCQELRAHPGWRVVLDESARLFVAVRKPASRAGGTP